MIHEPTSSIKSFGALLGGSIALGFLPGCATFDGSQKCGFEACSADSRITAAVQNALDRHTELGPSGQVQVATLNGVVYLYGSVANDLQLAVANGVATQAGGDAKIVSSIAVSEK